jgi:hypothetical protein
MRGRPRIDPTTAPLVVAFYTSQAARVAGPVGTLCAQHLATLAWAHAPEGRVPVDEWTPEAILDWLGVLADRLDLATVAEGMRAAEGAGLVETIIRAGERFVAPCDFASVVDETIQGVERVKARGLRKRPACREFVATKSPNMSRQIKVSETIDENSRNDEFVATKSLNLSRQIKVSETIEQSAKTEFVATNSQKPGDGSPLLPLPFPPQTPPILSSSCPLLRRENAPAHEPEPAIEDKATADPNVESVEAAPRKRSLKPPSDLGLRLALFLRKHLRLEDPGCALPATADGWAREIDLLLNKDKRDPDMIAAVIKWTTHDPFWVPNIRSGAALRRHFDRLVANMRREGKLAPVARRDSAAPPPLSILEQKAVDNQRKDEWLASLTPEQREKHFRGVYGPGWTPEGTP